MKKFLIKLFIVMLYFIIPYFVNYFLNLINISDTLNVFIQFVFNFIILYFVIKLLKDDLKKEYKVFKKNKLKLLGKGFIIFVIGLVCYFSLLYILYKLFPNLNDYNYNAIINNYKNVPILLFISTIFYYPIIEELIFKTLFKDLIKNKYIFVITTGLLYGVVQLLFVVNGGMSLLFLIPYSIFSMSFSYSYYETKSVYVPIIFRMLYNLIPNIIHIILYILVI